MYSHYMRAYVCVFFMCRCAVFLFILMITFFLKAHPQCQRPRKQEILSTASSLLIDL